MSNLLSRARIIVWSKPVALMLAVIAATGVLARADQQPAGTGTWSSAGALGLLPDGAAPTVLLDGRLLIAGGDGTGTNGPRRIISVFDATTWQWSAAGYLNTNRTHAAATTLTDGRVLIAGGSVGNGATDVIEVFDPKTGETSAAGTLSTPRIDAAAATLANGLVLIVGGTDGATTLATAEFFNPSTGMSMPVAASMGTARAGATATRLLTGHVLIAGGNDGAQDLATAELFHPETATFTASASPMTAPRSRHVALLLPNNNSVLIAGGRAQGVALSSSELFQPAPAVSGSEFVDGAFVATGSMIDARIGGVLTPLNDDGQALAAGGVGQERSEMYRFATIKTDKDDYPPYSIVTITGTGWQPYEMVTLHLQESPDLDEHPLLPVQADANGNIITTQFSPDEHDLDIRFYLTAVGSVSRAQNTFTDAGPGNAATSTVSASVKALPADGTTTSTVTVTLRDAGGVQLASKTVVLAQTSGVSGVTISPASAATNASGVATFTVKSTTAGNGVFQATDSTDAVTITQTAAITFSSVSLASSVNPSNSGQAVTLTATVGPSGATGKVAFYDGATLLGTPSLVGTTATLTTSLLPVGTRSLIARYLGDTNYAALTSATVAQTVSAVGQSGLAAGVSYTTTSGPIGIAKGDFNKDGILDLAVVSQGAQIVSVFIGRGDGTFNAKVDYAVSNAAKKLAVGDLDGDGNEDLVVAMNNFPYVSVLLGTGTGTFGTATIYSSHYYSQVVAVADFDRDGTNDVAAGVLNSAGTVSEVAVLLGPPNRYGTSLVSYSGAVDPQAIVAGDFNGDGRPDLVTAAGNGNGTTVSVQLASGAAGAFGAKANYSVGTAPMSMATGDVNADGRLDLVVANNTSNTVSVLLGNGNGTFQTKVDYATGSSPRAVAISDFNGDGKLDLVASGGGGNAPASIFFGNGNGTFQTKVDYNTASGGNGVYDLTVGDFNRDGRADIAVVDTAKLIVMLGAAPPVSSTLSTVTASPSAVAADNSTTSTVTVTLNNPSGAAVAGKTVTLAKTSGPGTPTISPASGVSNASGVVTFTVKSATVGAHVFTATDTTDAVTITQTATVTFTAVPQTIAFTQPGNVPYGTSSVALSATASSGLAVTLTSNSPSVCTVAGSTATILSAGTCSITAAQAGNAQYAAAASVTQTFTVSTLAVVPTLTANAKVYDGTTAEPNASLSCSLSGVLPADATNVTCTPSNGSFDSANVGSPRVVTATLTLGGTASASYTFGAAGTTVVSTVAVNGATSTTAAVVYGQADVFTTATVNNPTLGASSLNSPRGVIPDAAGNIYVADLSNNRVLFFPFGQTTATRVYGQNNSFTTNAASTALTGLSSPNRIALDAAGNLYISDSGNNRVLYFPNGSTTPTRVYGQAGSFTSGVANNGGVSADSLSGTNAMAIDATGNLYISDRGNSRVLFYPAGSTTATRVYGQGGSFTTNTPNNGGISASSLNLNNGIRLDTAGNLYVSDQGNNRVLVFPAGQTTATVVYGQADFVSGGVNRGGTPAADTLSSPGNLALDGGNNLYVADANNNRVLFYQAGQTTASVVYGQAGSFTSNAINNGGISANSLRAPNSVDLDFAGNIYISDANNHRVLRFNASAPAITAAPVTVTAPSATKAYGTSGSALLPTYDGFVNSETSSVLTTQATCVSAGTAASAPAGTYPVTCSGAVAGNYSFTYISGTLTVSPIPVTATLAAAGKIYDGTTTLNIAAMSCTLTGVLPFDSSDVSCTATNGSFDNPTAGNRTVTATVAISGQAAGNYTLASSTASTSAEIAKAAATITVAGYDVTFDGQTHAATGTATGVNGEDLSALLHLGATAHTIAGDYPEDVWTFDGDTNYTSATGFASDRITKASSSVTVSCPATTVYTGAARTLCTATVTGAGGLNQAATVTYANNTNVGTASATASFAGDANHDGSNGSATFEIAKATSSVAVSCTPSVTYTGAVQEVCSATVTGVGGLNQAATVSYTNNTNVGTASATATFGGDANHDGSNGSATFEIAKASSSVAVSCTPSVTYTGAAQEVCNATVTGVGGLNQTATVTYTNNTNVGTASATASFAGDANHDGSNGSATFEITKATSATVISCPTTPTTYTGSALELCSATVTGVGGLNQTATVSYTNNTNVGTASATATFAGDANHDGSNGSANFEITKATSSVAVSCTPSVTYTGAAQEVCNATVTGVGGLNQAATVTYANNTNVGTASATATFAGDANHDGSNGSANFEITKATSSVAVSCTPSVTYTGAAQEVCSATVTGAGGLNQAATVTYANNTNVGTASATATFAGDANHDGSNGSANFEITKATSSVAVSCTPSVTYTGAAQEVCSATVTGVGGLNQTATVTYTNNTNVGTASATATFAGDANHDGSNGSATFEITKATLTVTADSATRAALAPNPVFTGTLTGVLGADGITATYDAAAATMPGTYPIVPTLVDPNGRLGNYAVTSVNGVLTVVDTDPPVVQVPASVTAEAADASGAIVNFADQVSAVDAVFGGVTATCAPASGTLFPIGDTTVTCTAVDGAGNLGGASFIVTVRDTTAPTLTTTDMTVTATAASGITVEYAPLGHDAVSGDVASVCSPTSGSLFTIGDHQVSCTAIDAANNTSAISTFTVHVLDGVAPTVQVPATTVAEATSALGATVTFTASATDNVDETLTTTCAPASGSAFPIGDTLVTCSAIDAGGNTGTATFTVTVRDTTAPTLDLPTVAPVVSATSTVVLNYTATATDLVDGTVAIECTPASGSAFPIGSTTVSCSATDAHGNSRDGSFVIKVNDGIAPTVTVSPAGDRTVEATSSAGAVVTFTATASDNVDTALPTSCSPASGSTFPVGPATLVTCSATDAAGNIGTSTFFVTVVDTTPPTITVPAPVTQSTSSATGAAVSYSATATDIVSGNVPVTCVPASGATFPVGQTTVHCTAADARGNSTSADFIVTVQLTQSGIGQFVAFSKDNTRLRSQVTVVSGDVGANERRASTSHGHRRDDDDGDRDDITVQIGERSVMQSSSSRVVGDTVNLMSKAKAYNVVENFLINRSATVLGTITRPMAIPFLAMPTAPTMAAGSAAVTVNKNTTRTLAAGAYGAIKVENGATLIMTGGTYQVLSIDVDPQGTILFRGASEVRVKNELETGSKSKILLDQTVSGLRASQIVFYVYGGDGACAHNDRDDDGDDNGPASVHIGQQNVVQANIYAVNGTLWLKSKTQATGAFLGMHVRVGERVTLTLDSAFR